MILRKKIYVYALCDVYYDSFYLEGIQKLFSTYTFNINKFPKFRPGTFAVLIPDGDSTIKLIIDSRDTNKYDEEGLNWCDVYGKVNYNNKNIPEKHKEKIKPIGPSFGIKIWNFPVTIYNAINNYLKFRRSIANKREFLANYWRQYKRLPLESYQYAPSLNDYVFFTGSIWKKESLTNNARASFIKACKANSKIVFEGGLAPRKDGDNLGFNDIVVTQRYDLQEYLNKIKLSSMVFNTPAVLSCHGWKLGEFLAMGKAIITTHHLNTLPAELEDNFHASYIDSNEDIASKINLILSDDNFKTFLEKNSKQYFDEYLSPKIVIQRLLFKN